MGRELLVLVIFLFSGIGGVLLHYISYDRDAQLDTISVLTSLTNISSPSLSSDFYEPRLLGEKIEHPSSPDMLPINRTDFVYAR